MLRQACRVDSLCDHSMPEETHPVRGGGSCEFDPAKRPKKLNSCALQPPVSSCPDCMTRSLLFVEVRVPGLMKRAYECWRHCPPEHPSFAGC
jgi:hypothetical protein